jgi:hypothetical protein
MADGFEAILSEFEPPVPDLALRTRALIRDVFPAVVEAPWPRQRVVDFGVGPRKIEFPVFAFGVVVGGEESRLPSLDPDGGQP